MVERPAWRPILDGAAADAAWIAIRAVARAIGDGRGTRRRPSDLMVFWAYVAGAIEEDWTSARYDEATTALCESIESGSAWPGLFGGVAGAGWVLSHVSDGDDADEIASLIDGAIANQLEVERWTGDYDLIGGLVGYGVYFLERITAGPAPIARQGLARVIDHLIATCETTPAGIAWFTRPELVPTHQRDRSPAGYFNCGLAHGIPGVIALLGRVAALPDADPRVAATCAEALRWMHARRLATDPRGRFPASCDRGLSSGGPARTAWCYGDPGVAIAAWGASVRLGLPAVDWFELALDCTGRPVELCGVNDPGLCHGAAGLAHIFNRFYQASGDLRFRDTARTWFERVLAMQRPDGLGGFAAWSAELGWLDAADLIEGAAGVALALLAAVQPVEPGWDRMFQCDLPAMAGNER